MGDLLNVIFFLFLLNAFIPLAQKQLLAMRRASAIRALEQSRGTRVITMIHRQETMSFLGVPIARYIDIEDSEQVLRAIRLTPPEMPIDMVIHTPGGLVLAAGQIASALKRHKGNITVFVPHYAMSGGTLIALAADKIVLDSNAVLGPVDPQLGSQQAAYPAASILAALEQPNPNRDDQTLILGDVSRKAIQQVKDKVTELLLEHHSKEDAERIATTLSTGKWTHDYPIDVDEARSLGLPAGDDMPVAIYELMDLYPQSTQRRPGVEFIPLPYGPPARRPLPGRADRD